MISTEEMERRKNSEPIQCARHRKQKRGRK